MERSSKRVVVGVFFAPCWAMQSGGDNMMRPVHNSVDTVNAAAAAIVTAESRAQPPAEPVRASFYSLLLLLHDSSL